MPVIKNRAMGQTGCFRSGGRTGCELNVYYVIIGEVLRRKCATRGAVEKLGKGCSTSEGTRIYAAGGIVDQNQVLETRDGGRLENLAGQIRDQLLKQWNIRTR